jgi:sensor histidine kinase YesM
LLKYLFTFWGIFFLPSAGNAQKIQINKVDFENEVSLISNKVFFFIDSTNRLQINQIPSKKFYPFSHYFKEIPKYLPPNKTVWMQFEVQNNAGKDTNIIVHTGFQNYVNGFHLSDNQIVNKSASGNLLPYSQLSIPDFRQALQLPVYAGKENKYFISIKNITTYEVDPFTPALMNQNQLNLSQSRLFQKNEWSNRYFFMGIGMFLIMLIYILIKWIYQKDSTYFYYALSIFSSSIYFLFTFFKSENNQALFKEFPLVNLITCDSYIYLSQFAYWAFVRKFLYLDKENNFISKYLKYGSWAILAIGFLSLLYAIFSQNIITLIGFNSKIAILFLMGGAYVLFAIRNINQPLRRFVYGGIFALILFSAFSSVYEILRGTDYEFFTDLRGGTPLIMMGFVVEMLFFTTGLAYRSKLETDQIANIQVQRNEAELKAIRAQMNPHFIFNCMNTIDAYIFKEQPELASTFLNKFSKLIRQTLENSQQSMVSLVQEFETVKMYIELEKERFDDSFDTEIQIEPGLNLSNYLIPTMLLQPFVENAILHGLRNKKMGKGILLLKISLENNFILIKIIDNGIGMKKANELNKAKGQNHESMALKLSQQRLEMLAKKGKIIFKNHSNDIEPGTEVIVFLPIIFK